MLLYVDNIKILVWFFQKPPLWIYNLYFWLILYPQRYINELLGDHDRPVTIPSSLVPLNSKTVYTLFSCLLVEQKRDQFIFLRIKYIQIQLHPSAWHARLSAYAVQLSTSIASPIKCSVHKRCSSMWIALQSGSLCRILAAFTYWKDGSHYLVQCYMFSFEGIFVNRIWYLTPLVQIDTYTYFFVM